MFTISPPWDISCLSSFGMVEQRQKEIHSTTLHEYQAKRSISWLKVKCSSPDSKVGIPNSVPHT